MKSALLVLVCTVACALPSCVSSAPPSVPTWRDAWIQFLTPWCDNTARCNPEYFSAMWSGRAECVAQRLEEVCLYSEADCSSPYPADHVADLEICAAEVEALYCGALLPPDECFDALSP